MDPQEDLDQYKRPGSDLVKRSAAPTGTIEAAPSGPKQWLENVKGDIRHGTDTTFPGKALKFFGAPGISKGVNEGVGDIMGGALIGPAEIAHGAADFPEHHVRGANEMFHGVGKAAFPAIALTAPAALPEIVPSLATYGPIQSGVQKGAEKLGADPETAELIGNTAAVATPGLKKLASPVGNFLQKNAGPIARTAGVIGGAAEAVKTKNPFWLLAGSDRAERLAKPIVSVAGKAAQAAGDTPMLPHELIENPFKSTEPPGPQRASSLVDPAEKALAAKQLLQKNEAARNAPRPVAPPTEASMTGPSGDLLDSLGLKTATERAAIDRESGLQPTKSQVTDDMVRNRDQARMFLDYLSKKATEKDTSLIEPLTKGQESDNMSGMTNPEKPLVSGAAAGAGSPDPLDRMSLIQNARRLEKIVQDPSSTPEEVSLAQRMAQQNREMAQQPENPGRRDFLKKAGQTAVGSAVSKAVPDVVKPLIENLTREMPKPSAKDGPIFTTFKDLPGYSPSIAQGISRVADKLFSDSDEIEMLLEENFPDIQNGVMPHISDVVDTMIGSAADNFEDPMMEKAFREALPDMKSLIQETAKTGQPATSDPDAILRQTDAEHEEPWEKREQSPPKRQTGREDILDDQGIKDLTQKQSNRHINQGSIEDYLRPKSLDGSRDEGGPGAMLRHGSKPGPGSEYKKK